MADGAGEAVHHRQAALFRAQAHALVHNAVIQAQIAVFNLPADDTGRMWPRQLVSSTCLTAVHQSMVCMDAWTAMLQVYNNPS